MKLAYSMTAKFLDLVALVIYDYSYAITRFPQGPANNKDAVITFCKLFHEWNSKLLQFILLTIKFGARNGLPLDRKESVSRCFVRRGREDLFGASSAEEKGNSSQIGLGAPTL